MCFTGHVQVGLEGSRELLSRAVEMGEKGFRLTEVYGLSTKISAGRSVAPSLGASVLGEKTQGWRENLGSDGHAPSLLYFLPPSLPSFFFFPFLFLFSSFPFLFFFLFFLLAALFTVFQARSW